jgi:hypothetical protein
MSGLTGKARKTSPRKHQAGAELVEFVLTLVLFFTVFMLIIDVGIAVYDKGAVDNAARYATRQGSLFWIDPDNYDESAPLENQRVKESMITTAIDYWAKRTIISPAGPAGDLTKDDYGIVSCSERDCVDDCAVDGTWGDDGWINKVAGCDVFVTLSYAHSYIGLDKLLGAADVSLEADTRLRTESGF